MVGLPQLSSDYIDRHDYAMLFESRLYDQSNFMSYLFVDPVRIIKAIRFGDVRQAFCEIERYSKNFYLAGYFSYELGYFFEQGIFKEKVCSRMPLIHLGVFDRRFYFNHKTGENNMNMPGLFSQVAPKESFYIQNLKLDINSEEYRGKIMRIKEYIRKGDTYQVNFTSRYNFGFLGSAFQLYCGLCSRQHVQYSAFCKFKNSYIISLSPELFLRKDGKNIYSQPMKGTIKRGRDAKEDAKNVLRLKTSLKDKAENLMIVDLVRNDLGRVCEVNSVKVSERFKIRKYETLFQMTSQINGKLRKGLTYFDIFKNIFPGGSVTGAPKIRTMQIIRKLEKSSRGVYCGALGFILKGKEAVFNLPIRTVCISGKRGQMGVGSGIVYDSSAFNEFKECELKARFLSGLCREFSLIETIGWERGFKFLKEHLERLKKSAEYFGFAFDSFTITSRLRKAERGLIKGRYYRIRLLLTKAGNLKIESKVIKLDQEAKYVAISGYKVNPNNIFLYHKTTNRDFYNNEFLRYKSLGYFDVIFLNTKEEVTEGAISNIVIEKNGRLYTPKLSCGLLPGLYREYLLRTDKVREKTITLPDLLAADRISLCNSVRGMTNVILA